MSINPYEPPVATDQYGGQLQGQRWRAGRAGRVGAGDQPDRGVDHQHWTIGPRDSVRSVPSGDWSGGTASPAAGTQRQGSGSPRVGLRHFWGELLRALRRVLDEAAVEPWPCQGGRDRRLHSVRWALLPARHSVRRVGADGAGTRGSSKVVR